MATWNSRGLRGSTLEDLVNRTNEQYREKGLALIQKIPTPITPVRMDKENRHITLAYFEQRSTVDYIGAVQGIPVCFDAKECAADTFPLANIHPHQVEFMQAFEKQGGVAFFLIFYSHENQFYYLTLRSLLTFWNRMQEGGRKSFRREELEPQYYLTHRLPRWTPGSSGAETPRTCRQCRSGPPRRLRPGWPRSGCGNHRPAGARIPSPHRRTKADGAPQQAQAVAQQLDHGGQKALARIPHGQDDPRRRT